VTLLYVKAAIERNSLRTKNERLCSNLASEIRDNTSLDNELAEIKKERQLREGEYLKLLENSISVSTNMMHERIEKNTLVRKCRGLETSVNQLRIKLKRLEKLRRKPDGKFKKLSPWLADSDADYIKELEGLICFLAGCYEKTKETYFDKHLHTCSVANPNRRDLTDAEQSEWQRFPMIQGTRLQNIISAIAKANKPTPIDAQGLLERFTA
jgi:hypothetical protein